MSSIEQAGYEREVIYDDDHWYSLEHLRNQAATLIGHFKYLSSPLFAYGSIARGDVSEDSDIDLIFTQQLSSYHILQVLDQSNYMIMDQRIVMATPNHAIKGQIELHDDIVVTFPLHDFKPRELDFYSFGGKVGYQQIRDGVRVAGVNKGLVLIVPTQQGHHERSVLGLPEKEVMQYDLSHEILEERKRVLQRRQKVGKTGVFLNEPVYPALGFEGTLKQIMDRNSLVRNKVRRS